jgi:DNA mismatch repair protein MutS
MERLIALDLLCVFVTFVDEMASMGDTVVSMMSTVVPSDPAQRTYRVVRAPADGLAHALALAEKHGVTYQCIRERLTP